MRTSKQHVWLVCAVLAAMMFVGCGKKSGLRTRDFDVSVTRAQAVSERLVDVDLVGVSEANRAKWDSKDVAEYWSPNDPLRKEAMGLGIVRHMEFRPGQANQVLLSADDPIWKTWRLDRAAWLFVISDLTNAGDPSQPSDPADWRQIIPLEEHMWERHIKRIDIQVLPSRLRLDTSWLPSGGQ